MIIHWHGGCGEQAFVVDLRVGDAFFSSPPSPPSPNDASWQHGRGNLRRERASIGSQSRVKELQPILRRRRRERRKYTAVVWVLVSCAYTVTGSLTLSSSSVRPSPPAGTIKNPGTLDRRPSCLIKTAEPKCTTSATDSLVCDLFTSGIAEAASDGAMGFSSGCVCMWFSRSEYHC